MSKFVSVRPTVKAAAALRCQEQSQSHLIHQTIEEKLREDPQRREIGSFYVRTAEICSPEEGGARYWLRGNFWREEVAFPGAVIDGLDELDRIVEIDLYFGGIYPDKETLGQLLFDFAGFDKDGGIKDYQRGNMLMKDGTCMDYYAGGGGRLEQLHDAGVFYWIHRRLLLDFDLDTERRKDTVRQITDDPNREVGPLQDILRHLDIRCDPMDINLPFLRALPLSCFNRPVAIMVDHFMANVYSLQRLGDDIYVRGHTTHESTKAYHYR